MTYKTIYIQPDSALAHVRAQASSRDITVLASQKLVLGALDEGIADTLKKFQASGWPSRSGEGNQRLEVWVRPACLLHLEKLSRKHNVSLLKTVTAWMEASAEHLLGEIVAQHDISEKPSQQTAAGFVSQPLVSTHPHPIAASCTPKPAIEVKTNCTFEGLEQHLYPRLRTRHRFMRILLDFAQATVKALSK